MKRNLATVTGLLALSLAPAAFAQVGPAAAQHGRDGWSYRDGRYQETLDVAVRNVAVAAGARRAEAERGVHLYRDDRGRYERWDSRGRYGYGAHTRAGLAALARLDEQAERLDRAVSGSRWRSRPVEREYADLVRA